MSGYFYAFEDEDTARESLPNHFSQDVGGDWYVNEQAILYTTRGVWLVYPIMSDPDDNGEQTVTTPGTRSESYVILTPFEGEDCEANLINPPGVQGFA